MVDAPATTHGVFLPDPQPGGGFSGVDQLGARSFQLRHQGGGGRSDTGKPHRQIEGRALPRHQRRRRARHAEQPLAGAHPLAIRHQALHPDAGIQ